MALIHERTNQLMFEFMSLSPSNREEICEWFGSIHNQFGVIGMAANDAIVDGRLDLYTSIIYEVVKSMDADGFDSDDLEPLSNAYCLSFLHLIYFGGEHGLRAWEITPEVVQIEYVHLVGEPHCLSGLPLSDTRLRFLEYRKRMRVGL